MKKLLVVLGVLALLLPVAAPAQTYYVDYFSNNFTAPEDGVVRIVNVGQGGNPLTTPVGDICANIYVFDPNQEMAECCAERLTPNELDSADVFLQLTSNTLTPALLNAGVIKIVLTPVPTGGCNPATAFSGPDATLGSVWGTHPQRDLIVGAPGGAFIFPFLTETEKQPRPLSASEQTFLPMACSMTLYLGSGFGRCTSTVSGDIGSGGSDVVGAVAGKQ